MTCFSHLTLASILVTVTIVESSQCCNVGSSGLVQSKWQLAMKMLHADGKIQLLDEIVTTLQTRSPLTADVLKGHRVMDPVLQNKGKKNAYMKLLREIGIMIDLITNDDALDRHIRHFVLSNHVHYGVELRALGNAMEAIFWAVYQIVDLNPSIWYSCVYQIINLLHFHAAKAVGERIYARCDVSPDTGDPSEHIEGTILFEQSLQGGSTVIRGKLIGFDTSDADTDHGFHIHAVGSVGNQCLDAANHYNPEMMTHGAPYDKERHVGDLGNISEDADGAADIYMWDHKVSLMGEHSVIGRSIVIHASYDSFKDPATYRGRLGCCVITRMETIEIE